VPENVEITFAKASTVSPGMMIAFTEARCMGGAGMFMCGKWLAIQIIAEKSLKMVCFA